jgi:hypothetical protein
MTDTEKQILCNFADLVGWAGMPQDDLPLDEYFPLAEDAIRVGISANVDKDIWVGEIIFYALHELDLLNMVNVEPIATVETEHLQNLRPEQKEQLAIYIQVMAAHIQRLSEEAGKENYPALADFDKYVNAHEGYTIDIPMGYLNL